jgi:predicted RNA-binding Zn ribbon-like protein
LVVTKTAADLELVGGNLALDLANTRDGHAPARDYLETPADLTAWARRAAGLEIDPDERDLERVLALRETVEAVFRAIARGEEPAPGALDDLIAAHAARPGRLVRTAETSRAGETVAGSGGGFALAWDDDVAGPIAAAAVDLLRAGPLDKLKLCEACPWLFLDLSRNHSRRWCSMNVCGGTLKMRRYRARARRRSGSGSSA